MPEFERECDGCTACCDGWLKTDVDGCAVSPGNPCKHLQGGGCSIYPTRPRDPCATFVCGWLINSDMPEWMKPKTSKVIIKPNYVWKKPSSEVEVHIANACGPRIPGKTQHWMKSYADQNGCNFLCNEPVREGKKYTGEMKKFGIGSPEFVADVAGWVESGYQFYIGPSSSRLVVGNRIFLHKS